MNSVLFKKLIADVSQLQNFPSRPATERSGWAGNHFALPDGTVVSPKGQKCLAVFEPCFEGFGVAGTLKDWRRQVAERLREQSIPAFLIMLALAAPLLELLDRQENFGFEIVGPGGTGKSTAQLIMASVAGPAIDAGNGTFWQSLNSTTAGLETAVLQRADLPVILDESNMMLTGGPKGRDEFVHIIFQMAGRRDKSRFNSRTQRATRYLYCVSSNEPLCDLLGNVAPTTAAAIQDRLLTLTIDPNNRFGIFDDLPNGYDDSNQLAGNLIAAVKDNYGVAMRRFLKRLVSDKDTNEGALRARIARHIDAFQEKAAVDRNSGSEMRVAQAFGIVYAAGRLAVDYGVLPKSFMCKRTALLCYRNYRIGRDDTVPFKKRLQTIAQHDDVIRLKRGEELPSLDDASLAKAGIFLCERSKRKELLIAPSRIRDIFPDLKILKKSPAFGRYNVRDEDHATVKRHIRQERKSDRVYCFRL